MTTWGSSIILTIIFRIEWDLMHDHVKNSNQPKCSRDLVSSHRDYK